MPPHDDVIKYVGLPSLLFPSDHLALVADLKVKWIYNLFCIIKFLSIIFTYIIININCDCGINYTKSKFVCFHLMRLGLFG